MILSRRSRKLFGIWGLFLCRDRELHRVNRFTSLMAVIASRNNKGDTAMANNSGNNKNLIIGILVIALLGVGFVLMKKSQEPKGLSIEVSEDGIKIDGN